MSLGINPAAAISCVKPSGTVSQLVDCSSGIHPRHSRYYIRRVRADKKDPLAQMMIAAGFPFEDDVMKPEHNAVFSFPVKSPEAGIVRDDMTALEQLDLWLVYQKEWCEHKPSITVNVRENEWMEVGAGYTRTLTGYPVYPSYPTLSTVTVRLLTKKFARKITKLC